MRRIAFPRLAAWGTRTIAVVSLASALTRAEPARLRLLTRVVPAALTHVAAAATTLGGVLLLLLAHGLARRKRRAFVAVVVLLAVVNVLQVVKGLDIEEATAGAVLLALLLRHRSDFTAQSDPRTRWVVVKAAAFLLGTNLVVGVVLVRLHFDGATGMPSLYEQVQQVLLGLVGIGGPLRFDTDTDSDVVSFTLAGLGIVTALVTTYLALRPAEPPPVLTAEDEARLRGLLDRHGDDDSLGYFNLRRDKSVVWAPSKKAAVAYRVVNGVALVSGNPMGDPEAWPQAVSALRALADAHAWAPAVLGCGERAGRVWARAGLDVLEIGDEAVIDVADFTLEGRAMRTVRQAVVRIERAGYTCRVRRTAELTEVERDALRAAVGRWRSSDTEHGFSMALGRFGEPEDGRSLLVEALQDGELRAVLHFVPWGQGGLSLDVMRRDRAADNGLNEFLIVSTLRAAGTLGVERISLNFAVFRQALAAGERLGAGPLLRAWRGTLLFVSRWFQIDSLYRFNAKFCPTWEPRYLCYPGPSAMPRVVLAALEAEAFIAWPRLRRIRDWGSPTRRQPQPVDPRVIGCGRSTSSASGQGTRST
ncbi:MAG: putative rane protein with lysine transferase [Frankiales bacterium]|nr:putative rane protein with lysine transferase [Frankiales bacterium]MCW2709600.1 putative rane protein with lysine transferase [Frankiales bacterium]